MRKRWLACILISAALAAAQERPRTHIVRASGEATVSVKPDEAQITLGVMTQAATASEAGKTNAEQSVKVIDAVKRVLGSAGTVQTSLYDVMPVYKNLHGAQSIAGYRAWNSILIKTGNLATIGKLIDATSEAGANDVRGITFTVRDDSSARQRALAEAAQHARANAQAIAGGLNLHVIGVVDAESGEPSQIQPRFAGPLAQSVVLAPETPVVPEAVKITATVTVTLEVE
jgi:uncharacterized protein YggE